MDFAEARRIVAAFERHQVAYVVVGSMAMAAQGIVRATRDMDVAEVLDLDGVPFRTATARMLYRMKRDTVRPQDRLDAQVLRERFGLEED